MTDFINWLEILGIEDNIKEYGSMIPDDITWSMAPENEDGIYEIKFEFAMEGARKKHLFYKLETVFNDTTERVGNPFLVQNTSKFNLLDSLSYSLTATTRYCSRQSAHATSAALDFLFGIAAGWGTLAYAFPWLNRNVTEDIKSDSALISQITLPMVCIYSALRTLTIGRYYLLNLCKRLEISLLKLLPVTLIKEENINENSSPGIYIYQQSNLNTTNRWQATVIYWPNETEKFADIITWLHQDVNQVLTDEQCQVIANRHAKEIGRRLCYPVIRLILQANRDLRFQYYNLLGQFYELEEKHEDAAFAYIKALQEKCSTVQRFSLLRRLINIDDYIPTEGINSFQLKEKIQFHLREVQQCCYSEWRQNRIELHKEFMLIIQALCNHNLELAHTQFHALSWDKFAVQAYPELTVLHYKFKAFFLIMNRELHPNSIYTFPTCFNQASAELKKAEELQHSMNLIITPALQLRD